MLLTKLHIPPASNNIVHRTELYDKLNLGLNKKLILISAPAGFGKTTLLSDWINQQKVSTAWFSLDKGDNDPVSFLSYIISGIQGISKEFGKSSLNLLNSPNRPSSESILSLLINEILKINQSFLLVLDDFHLIDSSEILKIVAYLLEHIPENIHIAIITRSDPALSISRLRSQQQLVELRSSDLSFSANDISILFNKKLKLGLSIEDIYSLETKTEGWIAGLQLTAISMQGRDDISEFIKDLKGDNRYIMDYLIEEVLKNQSDDIKEFLIQTSILEQMSAPLCNAILNRNDSQQILETLEKSNMFVIPLDDDRNWYRYHHLFADLLKQRLHQRGKAANIELHNKASDWFKNNSMPLLAIEHAIETKDFEKSTAFLGEIIEKMWENGQHAAIMKYGDMFPDEIIKKNVEFCLYYSWILIIAGQIQKAVPFLTSAEENTKKIIHEVKSDKEINKYNKKLLGKISVAFAYLYSIIADSEKTFSYSKAAMENLSDDDPLWYSWGWYTIGIAKSINGNFKESTVAYEKALAYGKKSGNVYLISSIAINVAYIESRMGLYTSSYNKCSDLIKFMKESGFSQIAQSDSRYAALYSCMAAIECMRLDLDVAYENIKRAYDLSKNDSNNSYKIVVLMVYWLILYGRGDNKGMIKIFNETEYIIEHNKLAPAVHAIYIAVKGNMLTNQNEHEKANLFFEENGLGIDKTITYLNDRGYFSYAFLLITEQRFMEAEKILLEIQTMSIAANRIETLIEAKLLLAGLYSQKGNKEKGLATLVESLEYASKEKILMPFVHYYDNISELLKDIFKMQETTKTNIPKSITDKLKQIIEKRKKLADQQSQSDLSVREIDTLKLIAEDLTNQEIADKLFISLNTAKTHVRNILLKLDVETRLQAVNKAKEQGII